MTATWINVDTPGGYLVPLLTRPSRDAVASVLVLPALGTAAGYYERLVDALHAAGLGCAVMEMRGYGRSALRASRRCDWGFRELLADDIQAALAALRVGTPHAPLYLCGHSLGGHLALASAALAPDTFDGIVLAACGSPWFGVFESRTRRQLRFLTTVLPLLTQVLGYYPGKRIGFGGREARTLMTDWRELAMHDRYSAHGLDVDFEAGIAACRHPVLALQLADDRLAPPGAVAHVVQRLACARVTSELVDSRALGRRADHFGWCRQPADIVRRIRAWHDGLPIGERRSHLAGGK